MLQLQSLCSFHFCFFFASFRTIQIIIIKFVIMMYSFDRFVQTIVLKVVVVLCGSNIDRYQRKLITENNFRSISFGRETNWRLNGCRKFVRWNRFSQSSDDSIQLIMCFFCCWCLFSFHFHVSLIPFIKVHTRTCHFPPKTVFKSNYIFQFDVWCVCVCCIFFEKKKN